MATVQIVNPSSGKSRGILGRIVLVAGLFLGSAPQAHALTPFQQASATMTQIGPHSATYLSQVSYYPRLTAVIPSRRLGGSWQI